MILSRFVTDIHHARQTYTDRTAQLRMSRSHCRCSAV